MSEENTDENLEAILKWMDGKDKETVARLIARMRKQLENAQNALEDAKGTLQDLEGTATNAAEQAEEAEDEISDMLHDLDAELE